MTEIVTLQLDAQSHAEFERMRQMYYPPELNRIAAHLTLFHTLPDTPETSDALRAAARRPGFAVEVTGLRSLGRGVAYVLASPDLLALHATLAARFEEHLSAQDRQRFMPHVVIQNKAGAEAAKTLLRTLRNGFTPFRVMATGLELWHYLGGPWQLAESFPFSG